MELLRGCFQNHNAISKAGSGAVTESGAVTGGDDFVDASAGSLPPPHLVVMVNGLIGR